MGQAETKIFENTPPWDLHEIERKTDLDENAVDASWRLWCNSELVHKNKLKEESYLRLLGLADAPQDGADRAQADKLFQLLDADDDGKLEFNDVMYFIFSEAEELSAEQKLRRSFLLYDRNGSGKITKFEMMEAMDMLGMVETRRDDRGKIIIPDEVENLFSLMDFGHDGRIDEADFLRATLHYRSLAKMLTVDFLEKNRLHALAVITAEKSAEAQESTAEGQ